jgi:hypothetical protein
LNGWELLKPAGVDAGRTTRRAGLFWRACRRHGRFVDGAAVRHLAVAFTDLATIVLRGAGWRCGAEMRLRAGDGGGGSCSFNSCGAGEWAHVDRDREEDCRVIVDAGVDAAALARVLAILERR